MFDIQQFLISKQIGYRKEGSNVGRKEINICCPFCAESKYHCGINSGKNVYHCWVCGVKGDLPKLISKLLAISIFFIFCPLLFLLFSLAGTKLQLLGS